MSIKDQIIKALEEITGMGDINLEFTENLEFGDYSSNIAMAIFSKSQKTNIKLQTSSKTPKEFAEEIVKKYNERPDMPAVAEAKVGFINFRLKNDVLVDNLMQIDSAKEKYGTSQEGKGKTVLVDYSSPNIAKPFGIGHLRSTIIGQALYNLYKTLGYEVVGDNHLGDWGTQFGKLIYMIEEERPKDLSIETLEKLYVEFHKRAENDKFLEEKARICFKRLENGDTQAKKIWQECVDVSLKEFDKVYKLLGVSIDFAFGESYYESEMKQMLDDSSIQRRLENGEDGAKIIDLAKEGINTPLMFLKSDGATTYATRDLAAIKFRVRKWDPSIIIYEVGAEQTLHFKQVFAAARLLGLVNQSIEFVHTAHGLYLAPDGKKFSTRKGKTIKLEEVLDEAIKRAEKLGNNNKGVAREVGVGAIKYFDLMHSVQSNVVFDWDKIMNMEGNSGPYLQYTVARTNSVQNNANKQIYKSANKWKMENGKWKINHEESLVLRSLIRFEEVIELSAKSYSPNLLCNYLYDLAQKYNHLYNSHKILGSEAEEFRLALTNGTGQVLKNGLKILGIETPEKM